MTNIHSLTDKATKELVLIGTSVLIIAGTFVAAFPTKDVSQQSVAYAKAVTGLVQQSLPMEEKPFTSSVANRLHRRLLRERGQAPTVSVLTRAVAARQELLSRKVEILMIGEDGVSTSWMAGPQQYPLWIRADIDEKSASFILDRSAVQATIQNEIAAGLHPPVDVTLTGFKDGQVRRAIVDGVAKAGTEFDVEQATDDVYGALEKGTSQLAISLNHRAGRILNATGEDVGELTLLATGRSNFETSPYARIQNVKKALNQHVNNTMVPPGATYSFNNAIEERVTTGNGWYMAKIIVNGGDLEYAPGGGICQASTTVFRAMLLAGFVPVKRKAHSLYVTYYEQGGVGIDATIFPGAQDLTFVNDTGNYLLIQAYEDEFDAYVNIYGTPDGRKVALSGPYFAATAPADLEINGRPMTKNEIAWVHHITYADGREYQDLVVSRYKWIPQTLATKYAPVMHASAAE